MIRLLLATLLLLSSLANASQQILVIQGAPGTEEYKEGFTNAATLWVSLGKEAEATVQVVSPESSGAESKQKINEWILSPNLEDASSIWIVYLGHGTFNASGAKLNLSGEDLSADELSDWLGGVSNELVFIHGGSASAPFIAKLAGENRVIITATRSAAEQNYARFGERFVQAMADPESDLDRDESVSLLEAFLSASAATETFYKEAGRLSSEHALLDDNGDSRGTPATQYSGLRPLTAKDGSPVDGRLARRITLSAPNLNNPLSPSQIEERHRLEKELEDLYSQKRDIPEDEYYEKVESVLNELSQFYPSPEES